VRATRAFVGAFGAGVSLAIASSIMLLVVSSVVAFNGWPDDLSGAVGADVAALTEAPVAAGSSSGAEVVALPKAVPSLPSDASDRGGDGSVSGASGDDRSTVASTEPSASPSTSPDGDSSVSSTSGPSSKADPAGQVGDAVRDTTGSMADTMEPVAPAVSGALQSVGAAGADTVDGAAGSLLQP
jgi:hypothetical protein